MKASVIIATYGRDECLVDTIRSVLLQDYPDFELLVIDQSPRHIPRVESFLKNLDDPRYSYFLVTPPSLPAARNFGLTRARGEIVIYVDDDVRLEPDFIPAHVRAYERMDRIGGVGGRVHDPNRSISSHLRRLLSDGTWDGGFDFPEDSELITAVGCNMSFRRSVLNAIGGFDTSYEGNALREESDVCFRLRREGYKVWYEPKAALEHLAAPSGGCRESNLWDTRTYYQNETLFHVKNLGLGRFFTCFFHLFINHVLPHKFEFKFWPRLRAYFTGVVKGTWLALFPQKLCSSAIWESNGASTSRIHERALP